jgi:hypothetical protein
MKIYIVTEEDAECAMSFVDVYKTIEGMLNSLQKQWGGTTLYINFKNNTICYKDNGIGYELYSFKEIDTEDLK